MNIYLKGRDGQYNAKGRIDGEKIVVEKGSLLSAEFSSKLPSKALLYRKESSISDSMILQEDIVFDSSSTAAAFVTGNSTNGLRAWKDEKGRALGSFYNGKTKKPKKGE